ncbi:MAG: hypothetical protein KBT08_00595 [Bacteroidales bacterium]|nr:hypothetical protein [Candidatus Cryptobacteroides onthequi]
MTIISHTVRRSLVAAASALCLMLAMTVSCGPRTADTALAEGFDSPSDEYHPWCYWFWINGHVDRETIDADLQSMHDLGFRGLLLIDPRGYWDDDDHVKMPAPEIEFMSGEWLDNVCYALRKADSLGLQFTMNLSNCGGSFKGPWELGEDSPKRLMYQALPLSSGTAVHLNLDTPDLPYYHDVAAVAVRHDRPVDADGVWRMAGDGSYNMSAGHGTRMDGEAGAMVAKALEVVDLRDMVSGNEVSWTVLEGNWTCLRFGSSVIPGFSHDVDVLDPAAVTRHIRRIVEPLRERVPDLIGKTLTHFYSVSWEGAVPTWSPQFEADFKKFTERDLMPLMPMLAGFEIGEDGALDEFMAQYRKARNDMFRVNFYQTMRDLSHEYGVNMYSECGGPWRRNPEIFQEADQLEFLSLNDMPQGEFWCLEPRGSYHQYHNKGVVSASHIYGRRRASTEAFTHMTYHWSMYPDTLKHFGDQAFMDGINHFVWHTFTCSPEKMGTPGGEYFAGTHINRNVTWQADAKPFIDYITRCQYMLQQGLPVVDIAVWGGNRCYQHWGHYREQPYDSSKTRIPEGFNMDLMNTDVLLHRVDAAGGRIVLPDGMSYSVLVVDPEFDDCLTVDVAAKIEELRRAGVTVIEAPEADDMQEAVADRIRGCLVPDFEGPWPAVHRRVNVAPGRDADIYFVTGEGDADMIFRASGEVQLWDAVTAARTAAASEPLADGRTLVHLRLPKNGSAFVVFNACGKAEEAPSTAVSGRTLDGPWTVAFRYHKALAAIPPSPRVWENLHDLTLDGDDDVKHFSGTVIAAQTVGLDEEEARRLGTLSIGQVKGGLIHVYVNGHDCGVAWTAPWEVNVAGALVPGSNTVEICFTNTWQNRLIGDCALPAEERVTTSGLHYFQGERVHVPGRGWTPTVYSGYTSADALQPNGVTGSVELR